MRLADKVAIITGAASGIGRASACLFAREGAKVVVADVNDTDGKETVAIIKSNGGKGIFVHTDVTIASEVKHLIRTTKDRFGKIDILFNNAGTYPKATPIEDIEESSWDQVYAINVKSMFLMTKYAVPEMKRSGGGVIINTSSVRGSRPRSNMSSYASSKAAVIVLTKALAVELAKYNIRANWISPCLTQTPMIGVMSEEEKKAALSANTLGRLIQPEEDAHAALYLASDEAAVLSGTGICVGGIM